MVPPRRNFPYSDDMEVQRGKYTIRDLSHRRVYQLGTGLISDGFWASRYWLKFRRAHNSPVGIPMLLRHGSWRNPFKATKLNVDVETRRIGYLMRI
jgi:hypothetical protein